MTDDTLLIILVVVASAIVSIIAGKWFFEVVMAADWPEWLKYLLLR